MNDGLLAAHHSLADTRSIEACLSPTNRPNGAVKGLALTGSVAHCGTVTPAEDLRFCAGGDELHWAIRNDNGGRSYRPGE
jgi:hypothetical protein